MNFRAEAKSESTILLTWSPPRQDIILKYELLYKEIGNKPGTPEVRPVSGGERESVAGKSGVTVPRSRLSSLFLLLVWAANPRTRGRPAVSEDV